MMEVEVWVGAAGGGGEGGAGDSAGPRRRTTPPLPRGLWPTLSCQSCRGGGRSNGPYADSLPLSCHFQGGGGGQGATVGRLERGGGPGPQHI